MHAGCTEDPALYPAVKPVQMFADAIGDASGRGTLCSIYLADPILP